MVHLISCHPHYLSYFLALPSLLAVFWFLVLVCIDVLTVYPLSMRGMGADWTSYFM